MVKTDLVHRVTRKPPGKRPHPVARKVIRRQEAPHYADHRLKHGGFKLFVESEAGGYPLASPAEHADFKFNFIQQPIPTMQAQAHLQLQQQKQRVLKSTSAASLNNFCDLRGCAFVSNLYGPT